jgi:hypothetical protein
MATFDPHTPMTMPDSSDARRVAEAAFVKRPTPPCPTRRRRWLSSSARKPSSRAAPAIRQRGQRRTDGANARSAGLSGRFTRRRVRSCSRLAEPLSVRGASSDPNGSAGVPASPRSRQAPQSHAPWRGHDHPSGPCERAHGDRSIGQPPWERTGVQSRKARKPTSLSQAHAAVRLRRYSDRAWRAEPVSSAEGRDRGQLHSGPEALRKVEAAQAVRWIKRAIADYGLSARDLGL